MLSEQVLRDPHSCGWSALSIDPTKIRGNDQSATCVFPQSSKLSAAAPGERSDGSAGM